MSVPSSPQPPAAGRRRAPKKSPWLWVLLGCAMLAVIAVIGVVAMIGWVGFRAARVARQLQSAPMPTESSVRESLGEDVPIYPEAKLDAKQTRILQSSANIGKAVVGALGGKAEEFPTSRSGAFKTEADPEAVLDWYEAKLAAEGWEQQQKVFTGFNRQITSRKGDAIIIVQTQSAPGGGTQIIIMRMERQGADGAAAPSGD